MSERIWRWRQRRTLRREWLRLKKREGQLARWNCCILADEVRGAADSIAAELQALRTDSEATR